MRLTCPSCGAHGSVELFVAETEARQFADLVAQVPGGYGRVALRYIGLFRPNKRALGWSRACKLLEELVAMMNNGAVEYYQRAYPATPAMFANAMQQMLDRSERMHLDSHGYLIKILVGESPKAAAAAESAELEAKRLASAARQGSRTQVVAEWSGEVAARKRFGEQPHTEEERARFFRERGFEP